MYKHGLAHFWRIFNAEKSTQNKVNMVKLHVYGPWQNSRERERMRRKSKRAKCGTCKNAYSIFYGSHKDHSGTDGTDGTGDGRVRNIIRQKPPKKKDLARIDIRWIPKLQWHIHPGVLFFWNFSLACSTHGKTAYSYKTYLTRLKFFVSFYFTLLFLAIHSNKTYVLNATTSSQSYRKYVETTT